MANDDLDANSFAGTGAPSAASGVGANTAVDMSPPPGISPNYWQSVLARDANAKGLHWLSDSTQGGGFDKFASKADYIKFLRDSATKEWTELPDAQKSIFTTADANHNPHPADSPAGKLFVTKTRQEGDLATAEGDVKKWQEGDLELLNTLSGQAAMGDQIAAQQMQEVLLRINDPEITKYYGDVISKGASAHVSDETIAGQKKALTGFEGQYGVQETAEEKLMREVSRRNQEQTLRSERGAMANDLQQRGVYGSGSEIAMTLASQQAAAQNRAMEEMQANANAQKRSMEALTAGGKLATDIRTGEAQEVQYRTTAADVAAEANRQATVHHDEWVADQTRKNNEAQINRQKELGLTYTQPSANAFTRQSAITGNKYAGMTAGANILNPAREALVKTEGSEVALSDADRLKKGLEVDDT